MSAAEPIPPIRIVRGDELPCVWARIEKSVREILALAGDATWVTPESTYESLRAGKTFLILFAAHGTELGVVFDFVKLPKYKVARVLFAFGKDIDSLGEEIKIAEAWLKQEGCRFVDTTISTPSRARLFARFGYMPLVLRKELK